MNDENGRGVGGPGSGGGWASGEGAGPGGYGRYEGQSPYGQPQQGQVPPAQPQGRQERPRGAWPFHQQQGQPQQGQPQQGQAQPGQYGHVQPGPGAAGPGAPTTAFPPQYAAGGADPSAPGDGGSGGRRSGRGLLAAGLVSAMLVAGGLGGWIGATVADGNGGTSLSAPINAEQPEAKAPDGTVEAVADKVLPSVVSIDVTGRQAAGEGSGVILSADGLIITNNHVVAMAENGGQITVRLHDGTRAPARIVGTDPATDIAVIRVETNQPLTPITLGTSSTLDEGQAVAAVGSPLGLSGTVTTGIVSALDRPVRAGGAQSDQSTVIDAVQTDAAVNPGNSGGALVNMNGELVGINSAIASTGGSGSIGLGFAIPVDQARRIADQIIKQGYATRAVLGVSVSDSPQVAGALVRAVEPGGPAAGAGLREGAVITKVGERVIDDGDALVAAIRSRAPGDTVTVTYAAREGEAPTTADVALGEAR